MDFQFVSFSILYRAGSRYDGILTDKSQLLFIVIEGLLTVVAGGVSYWIIQDFPDTAKFLSEEERTFVIRRLQSDDQFSAGGENFKMKYVIASLKDIKTWIGSESDFLNHSRVGIELRFCSTIN